jgi:hypothetical protein
MAEYSLINTASAVANIKLKIDDINEPIIERTTKSHAPKENSEGIQEPLKIKAEFKNELSDMNK